MSLAIDLPAGWIRVPCSENCGNTVPVPEENPNKYYSSPITCMKCQDDKTEPRLPIYSGPTRTGVCVCGHKWAEHHLGMICKPGADKVADGDWSGREGYVPQECDYYGCNEMGGLDEKGNVHCFGYKDSSSSSLLAEAVSRPKASD